MRPWKTSLHRKTPRKPPPKTAHRRRRMRSPPRRQMPVPRRSNPRIHDTAIGCVTSFGDVSRRDGFLHGAIGFMRVTAIGERAVNRLFRQLAEVEADVRRAYLPKPEF